MPARLRTRDPAVALAPPASPVPAPRGTTGTRNSDAARSVACTCSTFRAFTIASGRPSATHPD